MLKLVFSSIYWRHIMKRRYTDEQIIGILKEYEAGVKATELCRKYGMSDATFYKWKAKFSGLEVSEARRLRDLEDENRRLKKLVADLSLDKMALEEVLKKI
jgi:putative transposase